MKKNYRAMSAGLAVAALIMIAVLTACTKSAPTPAPEPAQPGTETTAPAETAKPVEAAKPAEAAPAKLNLDKIKYVMEMRSAEGSVRMEYFIDKPKMKVKISPLDGSQSGAMNMISDGTALYMIQEETKTAIKMPMNEENIEQMMPSNDEFKFTYDDIKNEFKDAKYVDKGEAEVNGVKVQVYEYTEPLTNNSVTVYVEPKGLVRKMEIKDTQNNQTATIDILEMDTNPSFTDADFQLPAGYQVQDMSGMMQPPQ